MHTIRGFVYHQQYRRDNRGAADYDYAPGYEDVHPESHDDYDAVGWSASGGPGMRPTRNARWASPEPPRVYPYDVGGEEQPGHR